MNKNMIRGGEEEKEVRFHSMRNACDIDSSLSLNLFPL